MHKLAKKKKSIKSLLNSINSYNVQSHKLANKIRFKNLLHINTTYNKKKYMTFSLKRQLKFKYK